MAEEGVVGKATFPNNQMALHTKSSGSNVAVLCNNRGLYHVVQPVQPRGAIPCYCTGVFALSIRTDGDVQLLAKGGITDGEAKNPSQSTV